MFTLANIEVIFALINDGVEAYKKIREVFDTMPDGSALTAEQILGIIQGSYIPKQDELDARFLAAQEADDDENGDDGQ